MELDTKPVGYDTKMELGTKPVGCDTKMGLDKKLRFEYLRWVISLILSLLIAFSFSTPNFAQSNKEPHFHAFTLEEATIDSVHHAMKNGELTCQKLVAAYIDRIRTYNLAVNENPPINAITQINPKVLQQALELDQKYQKTQHFVGPLHCIPIVLKDNINVKDTITSAGSLSLINNYPAQDAELVKRLRQAGAIVLVKGAMDEFGWGLFGISSRNGRVGNVYDTRKNPGGSSAGVAAAISANFGMIGIGSDNSGSIRIPAVFNGLNGLRPSTGLISQQGIFPMGNLDAVAGPITRSIKDLAIVLEIIAANPDLKDPKTKNIPREISYAQFLKKDGLKNKRIGIIRAVAGNNTFLDMPEDMMHVFDKSIYRMKQLGATFINVDLKEYYIDREQNQAGELEDVSDYFKLNNNVKTIHSFQDICNSDNTRTFGDKTQCLKFANEIPAKNSREYRNVLAMFQKNKQYIETLMKEKQLDALLMPVSQVPAGSYNAEKFNTFMLPVASNAGLPALAFIVGYNEQDTMPVGIELIGSAYTEGKLIEMAYAYEQKVKPRKAPRLVSGDTQLVSGDTQLVSGDTQLVLGDTKLVSGDTKLVSGDTKLVSGDTVQELSIEDMNNLYTRLGQASYEKVLKNEHRLRLNAERFHQIFLEALTMNIEP